MVTDLGYRRNRTFDPRENIVQERQSGWTGCIFEPLELVGRLGGKAARMMLLVGRQNVGAAVPGRGDLRPARRLLVGEESDQWRIERTRGDRKSVGEGQIVSGGVDLGGSRTSKINHKLNTHTTNQL